MNLLREEYCKEINTPMGLDDVYDYVKWLENKLTETNQALQLQQTGVVGRSEQLKALLEKLLNENMCSVAGDELIEEALKGF